MKIMKSKKSWSWTYCDAESKRQKPNQNTFKRQHISQSTFCYSRPVSVQDSVWCAVKVVDKFWKEMSILNTINNPKEMVGERLHKDENTHQIQGQFWIRAVDKCDLMIFTPKEICVITVDVDQTC